MNIYKSFNKLTQYIDNHLEEKIEYKTLAKILGVNTYTMQRIFSLLTNITLAEYIRKRRLSNAGFDMYNNKQKVIDIALKYQYESSTAFSRAFESFHGIKPSKVNIKSKLKNFPRITFNEEIPLTNDIEYTIINLDELTLYGVGIKTNNKDISKTAPKFFTTINNKYLDKYGSIKYAMVTYKDKERNSCNGYYVLYDKEISGFEKIIIPKSKWLVFKINSQEAKDIQEMSHKFYLEFLPSCKYNFKELPELEYYHDNITDFLVPIY